MAKKTKIICTIGPSVDSKEKIIELIRAGMNVARLNFSHGSHEQHRAVIQKLKEAREELKVPLAIMLDTKGPEIRLGLIKNNSFEVVTGQRLWLLKEQREGNAQEVSINPPSVFSNLQIGITILFNDGYISSRVLEVADKGVLVEIENSGTLSSRKGVNIPDIDVDLPALTEADIADIRFGCAQDVDLIAASFIRSPEHVVAIKKLIHEEGKSDILVIAKIENRFGVQNFREILAIADGIMVARGDLGVEMPLSQVPSLQKWMIKECYLAGKPVITATQMLESMIEKPRPTRAEVSDVANAIYDSTSAVMLSGETAVGKYPIESVRMMQATIAEAEKDFDYNKLLLEQTSSKTYQDVPSSVTLAAVKAAYALNAKMIFILTHEGRSARLISRLRPSMEVIAMTPIRKVYHQLAANWGIIPMYCDESTDIKDAFKRISEWALKLGYVEHGDLIVMCAGLQYGIPGSTNTLIVESIGDVKARGAQGFGPRVHGQVAIVLDPQEAPRDLANKILLLTRFDDTYLPLVRKAKGFILQNRLEDSESERYALTAAQAHNLSVIVRVDHAQMLLDNQETVTLDPERAIIFSGIV